MPATTSYADPASGDRVDFANTLRGIAAILVVVTHYFGVFFTTNLLRVIQVPPVDVARPPWLAWIFQIPQLNYGPIGVAIFFLVSGFVIPFSLAKLGAGRFLVARFFRLWPTYAVGFTLSVIALGALYANLDVKWPFTVVNILVNYFISFRDLIGSPPIDGVVWTLEIEVKFYLLCALVAPLFRRYSMAVFLIPVALVGSFALLVQNLGWLAAGMFRMPAFALIYAIPYLTYMFIGTVFHYLHVGKLSAQKAIFLIAALYCAQIAMVLSGPNAGRIGEFWNYGYALLFFAFAAAFPGLFRRTAVGDFFASISYPLYVIHNIVGYALFRIMLNYGVPLWITMLTIVAVAIGLSWLLHRLVEVPSHKFGRRLVRERMTPVPPAAGGASAPTLP